MDTTNLNRTVEAAHHAVRLYASRDHAALAHTARVADAAIGMVQGGGFDERIIALAWLHDAYEDSPSGTFNAPVWRLLDDEQRDALVRLSRNVDTDRTYAEYIDEIAGLAGTPVGRLAIQVKLLDLDDNLQRSYVNTGDEDDLPRESLTHRYERAMRVLQEAWTS